MALLARVLIGALLTTLILWGSVAFYGVLAVWSPFPHVMWRHHTYWVTSGSIALSVLPCVVILGAILSKVFAYRAALWSLVSTATALLIAWAISLGESRELGIDLGWNVGFVASFLVLPTVVVLVMRR